MSPGVNIPPGYVRPDPEPAPDLPAIKRSIVVNLNDDTQRTYPSLDDYIEYYVSRGYVKNRQDLIDNYNHLIAEIFFNWLSTGQVGCLFAAMLAKKPRENRWLPIVQVGALAVGDGLGDLLSSRLDAAAENHQAAVAIFPDIITAEQIVDLVCLLCADKSGRWYITNSGIDQGDGSLKLISLRWILPGDKAVNYTLGFASIPTMPITRHSPFTAIFFRIREDKMTPIKHEDGRVQVHLADLDSTLNPQEKHDRVWEATKKHRALHVEPHLTIAARARITFAVSNDLAERLPNPRQVVIEE